MKLFRFPSLGSLFHSNDQLDVLNGAQGSEERAQSEDNEIVAMNETSGLEEYREMNFLIISDWCFFWSTMKDI